VRIHDLRTSEEGGRRRVTARVEWEDCGRRPRDLWFESEGPGAEDLCARPEAFVLAVAVPAARAHERRIAVEGSLSPRLRDGLRQILRLLAAWYEPERPLPELEPSRGFAPREPGGRRCGALLSGGLDSLALLRANRRDFPRGHPHSVDDVLFVAGFDLAIDGGTRHDGLLAHARRAVEAVARDAGAEPLFLRTNLRTLEKPSQAWPDEWFGSACAAAAYALAPRFRRVAIAAGFRPETLLPQGSHPLIDPHTSSDDLEVMHVGLHLSRVEKARLVAGWDAGLANLRVCWAGVEEAGPLNCGRCHKCVLTMLDLLAVGALGRCATLPGADVSPAQLAAVRQTTLSTLGFLEELLPPLAALGRRDLLRPLERKIRAIRRRHGLPRRGPWRHEQAA
jgi:hypothetical protein